MTAALYDVCTPWATADDLVDPCCLGGFDDPTLMDECLLGASTILYRLSGRRFPGVCSDVIRPTAEAASVEAWSPQYGDFSDYGGAWPGGIPSYLLPYGIWGFCGCDRTAVCGCQSVSQVRLPGYPVVAVSAVKIDGDTLDPSSYRLLDRSRLVFNPSTDGGRAGWPCCQDLTKPDTADGTWSVAYTWGAAPPALGPQYAALLACQLYQSFKPMPNGECRLPQRVTSVTRQGVSFAILDNFDIFREGMTGLPEIDLWLSSLNRDRSSGASSAVIIPDRLPRYARNNP